MTSSLNFLSMHHHEQLVYRHDRDSGLRALIAIHDTTLGPALGGTRLWQYVSLDAAALDVLRLSEGMTYKAAVAGLALGGGKSVIIADGQEHISDVRAHRFDAFGQFVESLGGRYIAAEDVGTKPGDMSRMHRYTDHVAGLPIDEGGSGDPSPITAFGVFRGIQALTEDVLKRDDLEGVRVNVQGLGKVGYSLASLLLDAGAVVTGTDVSAESRQRAEVLGVRVVAPEAIYDSECDIFAPCALGAVINDETIPRLTCKVIAGAANNQLENDTHGDVLHDRGIVYAVDYVLNAGGLINVACEIEGYDEAKARNKTAQIYDTIKHMLDISRSQDISTVRAAQQMAQQALKPIPAR